MKTDFTAESPEDLNAIAAGILNLLGDSTIILFEGEMGAGKTTLIKALCRSLGITDPVTSPTFSIVNEYRLPNDKPLYHFDLYRIENEKELFELGYEEYFYSGYLCFVEWPEKAGKLIPEEHKLIRIEVIDGKRLIEVR